MGLLNGVTLLLSGKVKDGLVLDGDKIQLISLRSTYLNEGKE